MTLIEQVVKAFPEITKHQLYSTGEMLAQALDKDEVDLSPALALAAIVYGLVSADYLKLDKTKIQEIVNEFFRSEP